ncbi:ABC transporter permease [Polaromonas sp.]|uniref:ABC transporter permease n=1 Tax=Polaromonas sp. TaxID=1869339 RepID=UPI0035664D75
MSQKDHRLLDRALGVLTIVGMLVLVEVLVRTGVFNRALIPPPTAVAQTLAGILGSGKALAPLGETLSIFFMAYVTACTLAVGLGLLMGRFRTVHDIFEPLVEFLRPMPKPALLPPLILFLGIGDAMKLTIVGLGVFFPVLINTVQGVRGTDPVIIDVARTFGHRPHNLMFKVILPSALPIILSGMRVSLGLGLILVVIAEMLAGTGGVGYLILDMQRSFKVSQMYAWIVILAVLGYTLNAAFLFAERRVIHWSFVNVR